MNKIARTLSEFYRQINTKLAAWHMSKKAHEYLIEALLIVFSVILALFLNEYRNNLKAKNDLEKTLSNLAIEIEENREILKEFMPYHRGGYVRLASIAQSNSAINALKTPLIYSITELLFPRGIFSESLGNSAWEIFLTTGQLSQIDIDQAQHLSKLYAQQESIYNLLNEIYKFIVDRDFLNESEVKNNLIILSSHLAELHDREIRLLEFYDEALAFLNPQPQTLSNHYQINVEVDPAKGFIKSHCTLHFVADKETKEITYWINDAFRPIAVKGEDIDSVWVTDAQGLPAQIREVHIRFRNTLEKGDATNIDFDYQGTLNADQFIDPGDITPVWTDLSVGALWYPLSMEEIMLTYEITLTAPKQYTVESAGEIIPLGDTKWLIRENTETPGRIILVLSDQLHKVRTTFDNYTIDFFVLDPADPFLDSLQHFSKIALQFFEEKLGAGGPGNKRLKICFPNLDMESVSDGGYSSNGSFIMLNNQRDADLQFHTLAHEIAHFWWRHGTYGTYHDFLNEGLAEFSTLMAIRETYGEEKIASRMKRYQKGIEGLGSIKSWTVDNFQERHKYLYWKGAVVMLDLLDEIGSEKLYTILQRTAAEKVSRYEDFLRIIEETTDRDIAEEFDRQF